jgi:hypothetical protein
MRYQLTDHEWGAIKPMLPNKLFVGRLVSYGFWLKGASTVGDRLDLDWFESAHYFVGYFLVSQLLLIPIIYCFTRIDWHAAFTEKAFPMVGKIKTVRAMHNDFPRQGRWA